MGCGQSIPIASVTAVVAGVVAGHYVNRYLKSRSVHPLAREIATATSHWAASSATGYAINAGLGLDAPGAAWTTAQSPLTAYAHTQLIRRYPYRFPTS